MSITFRSEASTNANGESLTREFYTFEIGLKGEADYQCMEGMVDAAIIKQHEKDYLAFKNPVKAGASKEVIQPSEEVSTKGKKVKEDEKDLY